MANQELDTRKQQRKLPWPEEWIWRVHRLHPVAYHNDCVKLLAAGVAIDKKIYNFIKTLNKVSRPSLRREFSVTFTSVGGHTHSAFVHSIDLVQAAVRQRDFLNKFRSHKLYTRDIGNNDSLYFVQLVQNYVSSLKLARKGDEIVPTFDIDLDWHSHMRRPVYYRTVSEAMCGFVLDHDDAIERNVLSNNFQKTADRWKEKYNMEYYQNADRKTIETTTYLSSCAVVVPVSGGGAIGGDSICGGGGGGCGGSDGGGGGGCGAGCGGCGG
ncbi:hypothetical protein RvY_17134 [Ramazzottius varieornatus]|uniref:Uncharacterized protein n=1 Tax=Ramazzottius varieornatus TaxID=947166 RepID=A0A1D1W1Y8_RAMVA|nr:hypothetical protein RvY_17134 [Ramazzottius varieornatus]